MSDTEEPKKSVLGTTFAVVAWPFKKTFQLLGWAWDNKIKTIAIIAAGYLGISHLQERREIERGVDRIRQEQRARMEYRRAHSGATVTNTVETKDVPVQDVQKKPAPKASAPKGPHPMQVALKYASAPAVAPAEPADTNTVQQVGTTNVPPQTVVTNTPATTTGVVTNTPAQPAPSQPVAPGQSHPMQVATQQVLPEQAPKKDVRPSEDTQLDKDAEAAVRKNAFYSTPTSDGIATTGDRAMPARDTLMRMVRQRAKENKAPDDFGFNTLLICSQDNPTNFVAINLGFWRVPAKGPGNYRLARSVITPRDGGYVPMIGKFNIAFENTPGFRAGINVTQDGADIATWFEGAPCFDIGRADGRTLLKIDANGGIHRSFDKAEVDKLFADLDLSRGAKIKSNGFVLHKDPGAYGRRVQPNQSVPIPKFQR